MFFVDFVFGLCFSDAVRLNNESMAEEIKILVALIFY